MYTLAQLNDFPLASVNWLCYAFRSVFLFVNNIAESGKQLHFLENTPCRTMFVGKTGKGMLNRPYLARLYLALSKYDVAQYILVVSSPFTFQLRILKNSEIYFLNQQQLVLSGLWNCRSFLI